MAEEFGPGYARTVELTHSIGSLGVTAEQAIASGVDLRTIWEALCDDFEVPVQRRFGSDRPGRPGS